MGDGLAAIEQAGGGEQKGSGADGGDATRARRGFANPGDERFVVDTGFRAGTAGDDQRVNGAIELAERSGVGQSDAAMAAQE